VRPDAELVTAIRGGDRDGFTELVRCHQAAVRRFAGAFLNDAMQGDDVAQQVFVDVWRDRARIELRGGLREHLLARARNLCLTHARSRNRTRNRVARLADEPSVNAPSPADLLYEHDAANEAERAIGRARALVAQLPDDAYACVWLRFAGGLSFDDIGIALDRPAHAVRALLYRQLALLRRRMESEVP
jgi:RNA polymerase sigma factor (sigma-70 family)